MELNPQQKKAVEHKSGPLLIIAGAGTGKTKVITERIAYIVSQKLANPSEILALTFTEKAAQEMQERVDLTLPLNAEQPLISTFHSFADQLLKQESIYIGLDSNYTLMTQSESYILFRKHLFEFPLKIFRPLGNPTRFISDILSHFSRLQDEDVSVDEYIEFAKKLPNTTEEEKEAKVEALELSATYKMYSEIKVANSKLDFGDLIFTLLRLLRTKPNILKKYHERFKYILVDEFQDTNYAQNILINLIAIGKEVKGSTEIERKAVNITVVGDDDQAIYKFRGAAISNILQFKEIFPDAQSVVLTTNYRSNQKILDTAYRLIENNNPYRLEIAQKVDKRLVSSNENRNDGLVKVLYTNNSDSEAERIALEISRLVGKGPDQNTAFNTVGQGSFTSSGQKYKYSDIAVLVRANAHADEIIETLRYREIPYKLGGSKSLYQRPEIQVLISFLKTLVDYTDEVSLFNVLSMKEWEFEPRDIVEIMKCAREKKMKVFKVLECLIGKKVGSEETIEKLVLPLSKKALPSLIRLMNIYEECMKKLVSERSAGDLLFVFFEKSGLKDKYMEDTSGKYQFAVENIQKYFDMLQNFWKNNQPTTIYEYIDYLNYSMEIGESPNVDIEAFEDFDAVNILTIHGAKGLEFPVVFVANMVSDRFPSRNRSDTIPIPTELIKEVLPIGGESAEHLMEERRLAYVAFTRAKEKLYLTAANYYSEGKRKKKLSPFIFEAIDAEEIDEIADENSGKILVKETKDLLDYKKLNIEINNVFSYTQLHTYEICPAQYKYQYVLKFPTPQASALTFGNAIHNSLKQLYERLKVSKEGLGIISAPTLEEILIYFEKNWSSIGFEDKKHEKIRFESGKEVLKSYFENIFNKNEQPLFLERSFQYAIDDFKIKGRIDRIDLLKEVNGVKFVEIIDYKTGKEKEQKEAQKEWQLQLYAYAVEETMGLKVSNASYMYVEHGKKVEVNVEQERKKEVVGHIKDLVKKIRDGDFTIPSDHDCRYCSFKDISVDSLI